MHAQPHASCSTSRFRFQTFLHDDLQDPPKPTASASSKPSTRHRPTGHGTPRELAIVVSPLSMVALLRDRYDNYEHYPFEGAEYTSEEVEYTSEWVDR